MMQDSTLQRLTASDIAPDTRLGASMLALNNAHAAELSLLAPELLTEIVAQAWRAWRIGEVDAFMLALDQDARYDNPNFRWFRDRFARFVYVDRIVVAKAARGRGLARQLYDELIRDAAHAGHAQIVCEVNLSPPNPLSDAFHAALGFTALGSASIHGGAKTVRYLARNLT
jgi:predicted GNAT superfamily acetyltransferase